MKTWLKVGCGCLVVVVLLGILAFWGLWKLAEDPPGMVVRVDGPDTVAVGDEFDLFIRVENGREGESLTVSSLDLADEYLAGFLLVESAPEASSSMHVPIDDTRSFNFDRTIAPGETADFRFRFRAVETGIYRGDVDVCEGARFLSALLETQVVAEAPRPEASAVPAEPIDSDTAIDSYDPADEDQDPVEEPPGEGV